MSKAYVLFELKGGNERTVIAAAANLHEVVLVANKLATARARQKSDVDLQIVSCDTKDGECKMTVMPLNVNVESRVIIRSPEEEGSDVAKAV